MLWLGGCAMRSVPSIPVDDRACYVGVVPHDPIQLGTVQIWATQARPGDRVITPACDDARDEELLNFARRLLMKPK